MAFGTGMRLDRDGKPDGTPVVTGRALDPLFAAVVEAAEEAVLNSMFTAPTVTGRDGNTSEGLDPHVVRPAAGAMPAMTGTERGGPDPDPRRASSWPRRSTSRTSPAGRSRACSRRCPTARTTSPRRTPTGYREPLRGARVRRVPDRRARHRVVGRATPLDEYPEAEQRDLPDVIAWLADQEWCDGQVGMWGTSYSGFNSLQIACERPPALKAICAIYATDDRWTDDVHWRGGALRLVDLVDYGHYMTPMCVLPPVPAVWGDGWQRRVAAAAGDQRAVGADLAAGEPRRRPTGTTARCGSAARPTGYERIECPVMIVAGWADGYRNNSFRTVAELGRHGVPHRLLAGPWAHADPATAMPGPRIDFDAEMVAWFDHWLRGTGDPRGPLRRLRPRRRPGPRSTSTCTRAGGSPCRRCRR